MMARWARKATDAVLDAEWEDMIEGEIEAQEHEEAALLHAWFPDDHPEPSPLLTEEEHDELMVEQWEQESVLRRLARRGGSRFARCVGGYVDRLTGVLFPTPWRVEFLAGGMMVWPKEVMA